MNKTTDRIDDEIKAAFSKEDQLAYDSLKEDTSLLELAIKTMNSRFQFFKIMAVVFIFIYVAIGFYCAWNFYLATEFKYLMGYALGIMFSLTAVGMLKLWYWMEMNRYDTNREIKRLELQVARLSESMEQAGK